MDCMELPLSKTYVLLAVLLVPAIVPASTVKFAGQLTSSHNNSPSSGTSEVFGVWNRILIDSVNVQSRIGSQVNSDCTHLGTQQGEVECFSIQQNFWISDSKGNMVLWVQNVVQLAELGKGMLFATYAFFVWTSTDPLQPLSCFPFSYSENICRTPIYTQPVRLPQFLTFYANISSVNGEYSLHLSNDFGIQTWPIPDTVDCPCIIDAVRQRSPPWGFFPFEFVAVGLDDGSTAFFGNGTNGYINPAMVQLGGGFWHLTDMNILQCQTLQFCSKESSTGENSANLRWDNGSGKFYWLAGASDQGDYISGIHAQVVEPPVLPRPAIESVLYIQIDSGEQVDLTIFDGEGRATGYDYSTGHFVQNIPNSFVTSSSDVRIAVINPDGSYRLLLTPLGSTAFRLLLIREFNVNATRSMRTLDGAINLLITKQYVIDANTLTLNPSVNYAPLLPVMGIALLWVIAIAGIGVWLKRRRSSNRNESDS
jgi:hypothetical protein